MALFGDLGKALGLGSAKDVLPLIGTAAGFYFGGPLGASIGSGIGSLAGGKSVNDALTNAALAYGVTSFLPADLSKSGNQSYLNKQIYGDVGTKLAKQGIQSAAVPVNASLLSDAELYDMATSGVSKTASPGFFEKAVEFAGDNKMLTAGIAGTALAALAGNEEEEGVTQRPFAGGEAFGTVVGPFSDRVYEIADSDDMELYNQELQEYQKKDFDYRNRPVYVKSGGAMFGDDDAYGAMLPEKYARKTEPEQTYQHPVGPGDYTGEVTGKGTGTSDSVPAWLSDGEFVLTAKAVESAGNGDRDIGAARLYDMMAELEATA